MFVWRLFCRWGNDSRRNWKTIESTTSDCGTKPWIGKEGRSVGVCVSASAMRVSALNCPCCSSILQDPSNHVLLQAVGSKHACTFYTFQSICHVEFFKHVFIQLYIYNLHSSVKYIASWEISPDITLWGWLGSKHQLTKSWVISTILVSLFSAYAACKSLMSV